MRVADRVEQSLCVVLLSLVGVAERSPGGGQQTEATVCPAPHVGRVVRGTVGMVVESERVVALLDERERGGRVGLEEAVVVGQSGGRKEGGRLR